MRKRFIHFPRKEYMSQSTEISVCVSSTKVAYTFGTGSVADKYGVYQMFRPQYLQGDAAVALLDCNPLPERHMALIKAELEELIALYDGDNYWKLHVSVTITRFN